MTRAVFLLVLLLPITGCDKLPFASEPPTLTGTWSGTSTGGGNSALWTLHITDTNGELTGNYSTNNPALGSTSLTGSLNGKYSHPTVDVYFEIVIPPDVVQCEYKGSASSDPGSCMRGVV